MRPASTPVNVEMLPAAESATAKTMAAPIPSVWPITAWASSRLDTINPDPDSEAAATIMIAELISMATPRDTMVSLRARRIAMSSAEGGSALARSASDPECR
ncbi:hypothetical protein G6F57_022182 [Rhizopus arrhizus]|nr:hypothetical protein G6F57_022182 [Rhizopus arrhizus]